MRDRLAMAAVLLAAAAFLCVDAQTTPIVLWDESRTMVNALEMKRAGLGVVVTYGGAPDLWNTKPPLAIWAMTLSAIVFGADEAALRLPSLAAALGTVALVLVFVRRATGSVIAAAGAAAMLVLSPGFFGEHAAQTADYDAPLLFFTTACAMALFRVVHRRRPTPMLLAIAAAAGGAALLTKDIAAVVPLAGVGLHALTVGRVRRLLTGRVAAAVLMAVAPLLVWLVLREMQGPGFIATLWWNNVAGRYAQSLIGDTQPASFYVDQINAGYFAAAPLLLLTPLALFRKVATLRERLALLFALCIAGAQLAVISAAASKLGHYLLPALPFMAIAVGISLHALARRVPAWPFAATMAAIGLIVADRAWTIRHDAEPARQRTGAGLYGTLFAALSPGEIVIWDPGFVLEGRPHYAPVLAAYRLIWADRGLTTRHVVQEQAIGGRFTLIASCDPVIAALLDRRGRDLGGVPGCTAIRR